MRLAYLGRTHLGGTYTVFKNLRDGLAEAGVDVRCVGVDYRGGHAKTSVEVIPDGLLLRAGQSGEAEVAWALRSVLADFDGVIVNVLGDRLATNLTRYLPARLMKLLIVHNITPGTYAAARAVRDHVHATVAIAPRIFHDLAGRYGFAAHRMTVIPHGVPAAFLGHRRSGPTDGPLRLLFVGRLKDSDKGCLWLPGIVRRMATPATLTIAGDGPDRERLEALCGSMGTPATFTGALEQAALVDLYRSHDVLLFPSRFEGFGLTLIEAMAGGCVPVATRIAGVTDTIVTPDEDGLLFSAGNVEAAAEAADRLAGDRGRLAAMSAAAVETVQNRFSLAGTSRCYRDLIADLADGLPPIAPALEPGKWRVAPQLKPGLRRYVPEPVKNWVRVVRERVA